MKSAISQVGEVRDLVRARQVVDRDDVADRRAR
jgi:hypothetical protein